MYTSALESKIYRYRKGIIIKMKKNIIHNIAILLIAGVLAGCSNARPQETAPTETADLDNTAYIDEQDIESDYSKPAPIDELMQDSYDDYKEKGGEIAFVLDGTVMDGSYNEDIYNGIRMYALASGTSFSYYNVEENTHEKYHEAIERAIADKAKIIVCSGYAFGETVGALQELYPEVSFLMVDGVPVDGNGDTVNIADNVHCILFHEEESGYLAGYLSVLEGYRRLGFIGGEEVPSVIRYGYGYLQGINDAALDIGEEVKVNYWYSGSFMPDSRISEKASEWYAQGTEIIFACGGFLYKSVLEAADMNDGLLIGVDMDQSDISERFLTSAVKGTSNAVIIALDDFYAAGMKWSESFAGQKKQYGTDDNCTGIPVVNTKWRFKNVTMEEYYEVYQRVKSKDVLISDETDGPPKVSYTVNFDD